MRRALSILAGGTLVLASALPARAVAGAGWAFACGDPFRCVAAECVTHAAGPSLERASAFGRATVVVTGTAQAQGAFVPAATSIACIVKQGGEQIGGCSGRLPGGSAVCADTATVDLTEPVEVCAIGEVLWVGTVTEPTVADGCTPQ